MFFVCVFFVCLVVCFIFVAVCCFVFLFVFCLFFGVSLFVCFVDVFSFSFSLLSGCWWGFLFKKIVVVGCLFWGGFFGGVGGFELCEVLFFLGGFVVGVNGGGVFVIVCCCFLFISSCCRLIFWLLFSFLHPLRTCYPLSAKSQMLHFVRYTIA